MIVSRRDNTLLVKTAGALVKLNDTVEIGDFAAPGPGEYDVAGVAAIILPTTPRTAVLSADGLSLLYLDHPYKVDKDDDAFANIDLVVARVGDEKELTLAKTVGQDLEPRALILFGPLGPEAIAAGAAPGHEPVEKLTISKNNLPEEGTDITVLA